MISLAAYCMLIEIYSIFVSPGAYKIPPLAGYRLKSNINRRNTWMMFSD
jgi:hypothetical protein